jgi:AcrR family transcriptional regulator
VRREQLVEAAFRRVAEAGFEGLRLRQVAADVGIDHSTLHHHVATKQELVEAVALHVVRQFFDTSAGGGLRAHLETLRRMMIEKPELFTVTAELDLRARRDLAVREAMRRFETGWREALVQIMAPSVAEPGKAAELVIATVKGVRLVPEMAGDVFGRLVELLEPEQE